MTGSSEQLRNKLLDIMAKHDMKQSVWARNSGIAEGTLRNFLKGLSQTLTYDVLIKLAKGANLSINDLLGDTKAPHSEPSPSVRLNEGITAQIILPREYRESGKPLIDALITAKIGNSHERLFRISRVGELLVLYPTDYKGNTEAAIPYLPDAEWDTGTLEMEGKKHTCRITGVVRSLTIPHSL